MTRKILKCGYLFVAPDWDFTNPIYRSKVKLNFFKSLDIWNLIFLYVYFKRWQRRWFVLFDDGELTYAVDDHVRVDKKFKQLTRL